jgi:predicted dehydrogenase
MARALRSSNIGSAHSVDLVGVVDPAGDRYHAVDGIVLLPDLDPLVHHGIDYAFLTCPTLLHEPLGTTLATAGIPTLIEKPLAVEQAPCTGSGSPEVAGVRAHPHV